MPDSVWRPHHPNGACLRGPVCSSAFPSPKENRKKEVRYRKKEALNLGVPFGVGPKSSASSEGVARRCLRLLRFMQSAPVCSMPYSCSEGASQATTPSPTVDRSGKKPLCVDFSLPFVYYGVRLMSPVRAAQANGVLRSLGTERV